MKRINKILVLLLAIFMLAPTFAFGASEAPISPTNNGKPAPFKIVKADKNEDSMADKAFDSESKLIDNNASYSIKFKPKEIHYMLNQADVTGITLIGKSGKQYIAQPSSQKRKPAARKGNSTPVPVSFTVTIPKSEFIDIHLAGFNKFTKIKFTTNLRDDFAAGFGKIFPDKMVNPEARILIK